MKIAIPSETDAGLESIRSGHFGHAAYMTVVEFDDDMNIVSVESVKNADHDAVGCGGGVIRSRSAAAHCRAASLIVTRGDVAARSGSGEVASQRRPSGPT